MNRAAGGTASHAASGAEGVFAATIQAARAWLAERRSVARIEAELGLHSDRELADLGLSRADIPAVARGRFRRTI